MENKREIKFRYWNEVSGIMVNDPKMPYKKGWTVEQLFSDRGWVWMQFTGLKDKNGKGIFEGDVIRVNGRNMEVFFKDGYFGWGQQHTGTYSFDPFDGEEVEVIGNIYENPELIEEK